MTKEKNLKDKRILLCPVDIGGNIQLVVEELRRRGYDATSAGCLYGYPNRLGRINDIQINSYRTRGRIKGHCSRIAFAIWAAMNYDIFHFFFGRSLYQSRYFPHLDLIFLRKLGKTIVVHFRGSDLIGRAYFDYLRDKATGKEAIEPSISDPNQKRSLEIWRRYSDRMLVSWPLLLKVVPDAVMVKQAIDLDYWRRGHARPESCKDGIIRIVHAPTNKAKKGTEFVGNAVYGLKKMGYPVELILVENMNHRKVKEVYERCDIGVDQLILGWYGNYSVELMALGKPVICYINPEWKNSCKDLPIVSAGPKELTEKLRMLIENPRLQWELGEKSIAYVKRHHDVKVIVDHCVTIYEQCL